MSYASLDTQQMNEGAEVTQDYCNNQYLYRGGGRSPLSAAMTNNSSWRKHHSLG